ncbi:ABC transporter permease [Azoarcus sp. KH32C]|uniref:ABC transporter permease n=1 Tax=Azoarcus sp. KH32C TaxID=748247 RepID=UPI0002386D81|nr:ABC transporter permease [Azoarcus sp. KH32C]BAL23886.1 hisM, polar amino acid ABC transporter, inner membrane subunit, histidine transport system permease protein [Azoarcus sp. KH32C]
MDLFDTSVITGNLPEFWRGLWMTLQLTAIALLVGFAGAIPLAVARISKNPAVRMPVAAYTYFFRGTPMLVQLLLIYYGAAQWEWMRAAWEEGNAFWSLFREPYFCALLAFGLNTCAYTVEIVAGSMRNTPHGEIEAAKAMGMSRFKALQRIVLPSALRRMIPSYSNEVILMLQGSAIASAVTLVDLTGAARNVYSRHFAPFESFIFVGLIYLVLTFMLVGLFKFAERRWLAHLAPRKALKTKEA